MNHDLSSTSSNEGDLDLLQIKRSLSQGNHDINADLSSSEDSEGFDPVVWKGDSNDTNIELKKYFRLKDFVHIILFY
jgi:hypothetical protein